jgi:hypothetical protein
VDRVEFSTVPNSSPIPNQFGPSFDLYSKDVYSQQSFAQLEPFFRASDKDPKPDFQIETASTIPGIIRHISTYSRSLNLDGASTPRRFDLVDFGAATGQDGAFGWYTDHPVTRK